MSGFRAFAATAAACGILAAGTGLVQAQAEKRVALVIGNGQYQHANALPNPPNDARAVAKALGEIGFEVVEGIDLDHAGMQGRLRDFLDKVTSAKVALLFYAGHGLQVDGRNYLVPVDARLQSASDLNFGTVDLDRILASLDDPKRANIVILDACRDNPLARSFAAKTRSGAVGAGLAAYTALGTGTLIAFATAPGKVAADGDGTNSPFTEHLVKHLRTPGLEVRQMLTRVRNDVAAATGERQIPWDNSSLRGDVYLAGRRIAAAPKDASAPAQPADVTALQQRLKALEEQLKKKDEPKDEPKVAVGTFPEKPAAPEGAHKPGDTFRDCADCPEMVVVPAGSFTMGSPAGEKDREPDEGPQRRVTIAKPFAVGKFEVTKAQFEAFVRETGHDAGNICYTYEGGKWKERSGRSWRNPGYSQGVDHPVACVNWDDAKAYVAWLSRKTGKAYRLLSEAEWEYAARAGTTTRFSCGDADGCLDRVGWSFSNSGSRAHPVGRKTANAFGLHDMHGNVWEWTEDCWNGSYAGAPSDGSAWTRGVCSQRVLRGGSWVTNPRYLRSAVRNRYSSGHRIDNDGFRVARTLLTP
jgi:formylglycine-generating enzyme required for sulfatase activity